MASPTRAVLGQSFQVKSISALETQPHVCLYTWSKTPLFPQVQGFAVTLCVYKEIMKLPRALQTCGRSAPNPDPSAPLGGHSGGLSLTLNQPQGTWVLRAQAALAQLPAKAFKEQKGVRNTCTLFPSAPRLSSSLQPNTLPCSFPTCLLRIDLHYPILPGAVGIN